MLLLEIRYVAKRKVLKKGNCILRMVLKELPMDR
jgi:hypothetical protein